MIDGARLLSPRIIKYALKALKMYDNPVVSTLAWHIGPDIQSVSVTKGYNKEVEDKLLENIHWREDGYRLFDISSLAGSSRNGYFMPIAESNCFFLKRKTHKK